MVASQKTTENQALAFETDKEIADHVFAEFGKQGIEPLEIKTMYEPRLKKYFVSVGFAPQDVWRFKDGGYIDSKTFAAPDTETLKQKISAIASVWRQGNTYPKP